MTITAPSLYPGASAPQLPMSFPQRPSYQAPLAPSRPFPNLAAPVSTSVTTGRSQWPVSLNASNASGFPGLPSPFPPLGAGDRFSNYSTPSPGSYGQFSAPRPAAFNSFSPAGGGSSGLASALSSLTDTSQPLTADAMGQKVGTVVASFMKENPALLEKLNGVDLDALAEDIGPKVEKARAQIQQALKKMPQAVDNRLIRMLDPGTRELATEFDQWLRKEPDPVLLAQMAREERLKDQQEAAKTQRPGLSTTGLNTNGGSAVDPFADADPFGDAFLAEKPATWKDKIGNAKDKLVSKAQSTWPFNRKQKKDDAFLNGSGLNDSGLNAQDILSQIGTKAKPKPTTLDGGLTEADLDALLGGGGLTFKANAKK